MTASTRHAVPVRPEPVTGAAALAGAVTGVLITVGGLLRLLGLALPFDLQAVADQVSNVIMALAVLSGVTGPWLTARFRARPRVTPLESPVGADGVPLITSARVRELIAEAQHAALEQARDEYNEHLVRTGQLDDDPGQHAAERTGDSTS